MITEQKLDFWLKNNYNVLMKGGHGVGKTAMITEAFTRNGMKWLYFSASTMDPWVDFIGVPKEMTDENGNKYLGLVRPQAFQNDEVEAIFFDEFNRSAKKVRNAVMELIQFKSINGKKFNNLKVIWAAINPDDEDDTTMVYDVEKLDPAQLDRFQVIVDVENKPSLQFFSMKYGATTAKVAIEWWNTIPLEHRKHVSPRRLDYILDMFVNAGGDVDDVLPKTITSKTLIDQLRSGSYTTRFKEIMDTKNYEALTTALNNSNFYSAVGDLILKNPNTMEVCVPYFPPEIFAKLMGTNKKFRSDVLKNKTLFATTFPQIEQIVKTGGLTNVAYKELKSAVTAYKRTIGQLQTPGTVSALPMADDFVDDVWFDTRSKDTLDNTYRRKQWATQFIAASFDSTDIDETLIVKYLGVYLSTWFRTQGGCKTFTTEMKDGFNKINGMIDRYNQYFNTVSTNPFTFSLAYGMLLSTKFYRAFGSSIPKANMNILLKQHGYLV
jgi:hypothetical protein